jgi:hypothetical protein
MVQIFKRTALPISPNKTGKMLTMSMMMLCEYECLLARFGSLKTPQASCLSSNDSAFADGDDIVKQAGCICISVLRLGSASCEGDLCLPMLDKNHRAAPYVRPHHHNYQWIHGTGYTFHPRAL